MVAMSMPTLLLVLSLLWVLGVLSGWLAIGVVLGLWAWGEWNERREARIPRRPAGDHVQLHRRKSLDVH